MNESNCVSGTRSVVLATYQGEKFLGEQLASILCQLSKTDEVIVSDDASIDGTLRIVREINDPRVRLIPNTNRVGYVRNFERAIRQANGEKIFFSDQDDVWLPEKMEKMSAALDAKSCVASDAIVVSEDLTVLHRSYFCLRQAHSFSWQSLFVKPKIVGATLACRREYLETLLPFPEDIPHDFWITLNAAWDEVLKIISEPLILYRRHDAAASPTATRHRRPISIITAERFRIMQALLSRRLHTQRTPHHHDGT